MSTVATVPTQTRLTQEHISNDTPPWAAGNGGGGEADGPSLNGLAASASITIPANSVLVFARDQGD
jgi:hypothetical protein